MAPLGQTIAVIDKSGKVVSTSKQLFGVFHHAKAAYHERKSKFDSERNAKIAEQQALRALANYNIDESKSVDSRRSRRSKTQHYSSRSRPHGRPSSYYEQDSNSATGRREFHSPSLELPRRHTHHDLAVREPERRPTTTRSKSDALIDMDLAYGDAHPAALSKYNTPEPVDDQKQLKGLVNRTQWLLEEAHCVQHSATATIAHLQKNPDAMAAVALTLAEISNLVSKMAPAALSAFKSAAPAVFALLSSPQFLIAAGVGIGVTVVMFGGYKIIKKIQSGNEKTDQSTGMDDMMELNAESCSRVEMWRRGVADVKAVSVGTSVDGEFITPRAAALSGMDVTTARMKRDHQTKYHGDGSVASSHRSRRSRTSRTQHSTSRSKKDPDSASAAPSGLPAQSSKHKSKSSSRAPSKASSKTSVSFSEKEKRTKEKPKKKGPSRLRLMFKP